MREEKNHGHGGLDLNDADDDVCVFNMVDVV